MIAHSKDHQPPAGIHLEEYLLRRAALDLEKSELHLLEAVNEAVSHGIGWERIGQLLGSSAHEARDTYDSMIRHAS